MNDLDDQIWDKIRKKNLEKTLRALRFFNTLVPYSLWYRISNRLCDRIKDTLFNRLGDVK